jgi:hypothetical protein
MLFFRHKSLFCMRSVEKNVVAGFKLHSAENVDSIQVRLSYIIIMAIKIEMPISICGGSSRAIRCKSQSR